MSNRTFVSDVCAAANGQWGAILTGLGVGLPKRNKHAPCPACGGTDRFRFDDQEGRGTHFCNQCGSGDGLNLLQKVHDCSAVEAARMVAGFLGLPDGEIDRETIERNRQRVAERQREERQQEELQRQKTASRAEAILRDTQLGKSGYLQAKGLDVDVLVTRTLVRASGINFEPGTLAVPVRDDDGTVRNVQLIKDNGDRAFLPGKGTKAGFFHAIDGDPGADHVALVEGYATGLSVQLATGWPVVVAFSDSGLAQVIETVAQQHPGRTPVVCADHDEADPRTGKRPGIEAAQKAAALVPGAVIALAPDEGTDWDDYRQQHGAEATGQAIREAMNAMPARAEELDQLPAEPEPVQDPHSMPVIVSWPHMSDRGKPLNTIPNLKCLLDHYGVVVRYDVIRKELIIRYPGQCGTVDNQRQVAMNTILSLCSLNSLPKADAPAFVMNVADQNPVNPVMEWITSKPWDGRDRLPELYNTLTVEPRYDTALRDLLMRRWLISAVAAAAMPSGFRSKGVLTLQGDQSLGKTAWFMALVPEEQRELLKVDATIDPNNRDSVASAVGHWLVELGELDSTFNRADLARLKGFISSDYDLFRRPYARCEEKYPRKTVFMATVNRPEFLIDDTGNSRWWTVPVTAVNYQHGLDMQQLWAQVYSLFKAGERWWLTREEEQWLEGANDDHRQQTPIEEILLTRYDRTQPAIRAMTATEALIENGFDKPTRAQLNEAGKAMRTIFGEPRKTNGRKVFMVPPRVDEAPF